MPNYVGLWSSRRIGKFSKTEIWTRDRRSDNIENFVKHAQASLERKLDESSDREKLQLLAVFEQRDQEWVLVHKTNLVDLGEYSNEKTSTKTSELRDLHPPELHAASPRIQKRASARERFGLD